MNKSEGELARKKLTGFLFLALVCFFNTVPLFIISVLANLDSVSDIVSRSTRSDLFSVDYIRDISCRLVEFFSHILCFRFWCSATCGVRSFWFLFAFNHEMVDAGTRPYKSCYAHFPNVFSPFPLVHGCSYAL